MTWVPIQESEVAWSFFTYGSFDPGVTLTDSVISGSSVGGAEGYLELDIPDGTLLRVTSNSFSSDSVAANPAYFQHDQGDVYNTNAVDDPAFWTPTPFETGATAYLQFRFGSNGDTGSFQFLVEVEQGDPEPARRNPLDVLGRTVVGYASAYSLAQTQPRRVRRYQSRILYADFNGAMHKDDRIVAVRWDTTSPWATYISSAAVSEDQRSVSLRCKFNFAGMSAIKATVETEGGDFYDYMFTFTVLDMPLFPAANYDLANGPFYLTAAAT